MIDSFQGIWRFLSNFFTAIVFYEGVAYRTVEHAYQAAKTLVESERIAIKNAATPGEAKRLGRKVTLRPDWNQVKLSIMEDLLRQKFAVPSLRNSLLATGDRELIEGNTWGDTYWGICRGTGENNLGKLLMKIRKELREQI